MTEIHYPGSELDLFAQAQNWKRYWSSILRPLLGRRILDVGAGIGATIDTLADAPRDLWLALEPDPALAQRLATRMAAAPAEARVRVQPGTVAELPPEARFDAILYIDVLEHIADDRAELARAARHLAPGGRLIVLSPAHQWLYSPFDAAIGHVRRYSRARLRAAAPDGVSCERLSYLDSVGLLASAGNRLVLRAAQPTASQVRLWDRAMVPASRFIDPILFHRLGKSVLGIWRRAEAPA